MKKYYDKENYVSVWIGRCDSQERFNNYIKLKHIDDDFEFELGNDFGICFYDEDFSLVCYSESATSDLSSLLDTGAPDYVMDYFIAQEGRYLQEEYNCCVMFYDMNYTGEVKEVLNEHFGKFMFLGSMVSDKFDML